MIEFISKTLNWVCACIGAVIMGILGYSALCGDLGQLPKQTLAIAIGVIAVIVLVKIGIGLKNAKTTNLLGDED